jgi:hypothetical protein
MSPRPEHTGEPHDRQTRIAARLIDASEADPELAAGERIVVLVSDDETGGLGLRGYDGDDPTAAVVDILGHARAIMRAYGGDLALLPLDARPRG